MRHLMPTQEEVKEVEAQLFSKGEANYKNSIITISKKNWFIVEGVNICAQWVDELMMDINDLQRSIDFDNGIK